MPKNNIYKVVALLLFYLFTIDASANAGGTSWKVKITSLKLHSYTSATVILQMLSESKLPSGYPFHFSNCPMMLVNIEYKPETSYQKTWSMNLTKQKHQLALASLKTAYEKAPLTRFGVVGNGLARSRNINKITSNAKISTKCQFDSRGIDILVEHANDPVVYSFNGRI